MLASPVRGGSKLSAYEREGAFLSYALIAGSGPGPGGLDGKRALVTGGTRGMGEAIAGLPAAHKASVVVAGRNELSSSPSRLIQADLASPEGAALVASHAAGILGGLDIVVHCVGASFAKPGGTLALTEDDWMQSLNTNLLSAVRLDRAILTDASGTGFVPLVLRPLGAKEDLCRSLSS